MSKKEKITVQGTEITVISEKNNDYISLTDMAGYKDVLEARVVVSNWMSTRFTLEFLGIWEEMYNPNFNRMEFHTIKNADGRLVLTPKRWVERTNAIGIFSKSGRYGGGIFAHKDIAFEFGSWLSAAFKFYLIKEYQHLKEDETHAKSLEWNLQRTLSKINYRIHTDAIKDEIIPKMVSKEQTMSVYANEADLLNVALFVKQPKNGAMKTQMTKAISEIMPHWNSWLCYQIWKVSMPCSLGRDFRKANGLCNSMAWRLRKCAH
jgi:hypothetical protein